MPNNPKAAENLTAPKFKPGQSGNPSGRSSAELKAMNESARIASELTLKAMETLQSQVTSAETEEKLNQVLSMLLNKDTRGMIVEAQNRAHGTPKQTVDMQVTDSEKTDEQLQAELDALQSKAGEDE